jgi:hypothetical protein
MSGDVLAWYLKECLLKAKQTLVHVSDPPKKPTTRDKTKPLNSQMVGFENGQSTIKGILSRTQNHENKG